MFIFNAELAEVRRGGREITQIETLPRIYRTDKIILFTM
jgi:hypothetical protein